ncbi:hypothetical protein Hokovirus_1_140 [Hokovirus HKV1]|uniref:Uncharacterized protein n=1 Tax=Hokovirus HKV1 TaxID=1977638 RepID=A0A1V0SF10_9VIRU|nr:hypothetical protein Hokovirus_1_140 [Hokovirus HKV1]
MGKNIYDKYSYLHFCTGSLAFYYNISLILWLILHILFEIIENSKKGIYFIDNYLTIWPGGKKSSDSLINSISDTIFGILGWIVAYYVNNYFDHENLQS